MTQRGFSIIELLIVVSVAVIIFILATSTFSTFNKNRALSGSVENVVSVLETARSRTLASKDDYVYGVHFETDRVILFRDNTYDSGTTTNETTLLSTFTTITDISLLGGGDDVIFQKITGKVAEDGTITITLLRDTSASTTITILPTGVIEY